jgi:hypothetical protein
MSDFHRPTYTFPFGAYNATEVKLYGIPGILKAPGEIRLGGKLFEIKMVLSEKSVNSEDSAIDKTVESGKQDRESQGNNNKNEGRQTEDIGNVEGVSEEHLTQEDVRFSDQRYGNCRSK